MLQAGRSLVLNPMWSFNFFNWSIILRVAPWAGVYSASNRTEHQKIFLVVKLGRRVRLIISPPSVRRLHRQRRILDISQPYRLPRFVTRIALLNSYSMYGLLNESAFALNPVKKTETTTVGDPPRWPRDTPLFVKGGTNFADKRRSFGRYSPLSDWGHVVS
jgi:hypothetical protein